MNEENIYNIKDEFKEIFKTTKEAIKKYPYRKEQIIIDFLNMCLRSDITGYVGALQFFIDNGYDEKYVINNYYINYDGITKRKEPTSI